MEKFKLLCIFLLVGCFNQAFAQYSCITHDPAPGATQDEQALNTYWHYRYRLTHYFLVGGAPGSKQGMSIPGDVRNESDGSMGWTDGLRLVSWYIETLATEYALLKQNHISTDETIKELYLALHVLYRLDSNYVATAVIDAGGTPPNPNVCPNYNSSIPFPGYGIMAPDDIGQVNLAVDDPLNAGLYSLGYSHNGPGCAFNFSQLYAQTAFTGNTASSPTIFGCAGFSNPPPGGDVPQDGLPIYEQGDGIVGPINMINGTPTNTLSVASQDDFMAVLIALAMVHTYVDKGIQGFSGNSDPYGYKDASGNPLGPEEMADKLANAVLFYIFNASQLTLVGCDGNKLYTLIGQPPFTKYWMWPYYPPLRNIAENIFKYSLPAPQPYLPPDLIAYSYIFGAVSATVIATFDIDPSVIWKNFTPCISQTLGCGYTTFELALMGAAMGNDGGPFDTRNLAGDITQNGVCNMIQAFGSFDPFTSGCTFCNNFSTLTTGQEIYYGAINDLLYGTNCSSVNLCNMRDIIYSAPYHGPFCHSANDLAGCGWCSTRRFGNNSSQDFNGDANSYGNYNGLDYMLLFNMYYLISEQESSAAGPIIIPGSDPTNVTVYPTLPTYNYVALPPISNGYPPSAEIGGTAIPVTITADPYCNEIIINKYNILNAAQDAAQGGSGQNGYVTIEGGKYSSIDMNPTGANSITISNGAYFDAVCNHICCSAIEPNYEYQSDPGIPNDKRAIRPPYQPNIEFDTINGQNGIMTYPNPFTNEITINYYVTNDNIISIYLTDVNGKKIVDIINNKQSIKGLYSLHYNGSSLTNGIYFCVMETNRGKSVFKMIKAI
jgi:hypothetical protein